MEIRIDFKRKPIANELARIRPVVKDKPNPIRIFVLYPFRRDRVEDIFRDGPSTARDAFNLFSAAVKAMRIVLPVKMNVNNFVRRRRRLLPL